MSVIKDYLTKNKVMAVALVAAIAPLSFQPSAGVVTEKSPNPAFEMVTLIAASKNEKASDKVAEGPTRTDLNNFFEMKRSYEDLMESATDMNLENHRIQNQIEKIIWLYDELHAISAGVNGRISVHEEVKLLAGVAGEWLREQKINKLLDDNLEPDYVRFASFNLNGGSPKDALDGAQALKDFLAESEDLYQRTDDLIELSKQYVLTNNELRKGMETMLKQLDVLYAAAQASPQDFDVSVPVKAIEAFQVAIDDYIELRDASFVVEEKAAERDQVGDLIRELDDVQGPALSSMKP